jgi:hypothetical protein
MEKQMTALKKSPKISKNSKTSKKKNDQFFAGMDEEYRRREYRTLEEQKEDEATMTLEELEAKRDRLAAIVKDHAEHLACEISAVDDCMEEEENLVEKIKHGKEEPFDLSHCGDVADAANDFPIYLRQWTEAVNAVLRRKAQMVGNGAPTLE